MRKTIYERYYGALNKAYPEKVEDTGMDYWRNRLFIRILTFFLPVALLVVIPGVFMSISAELPLLAVAELIALLSILAAAFAPGLGINTRKAVFIISVHLVAFVLLYYLGAWGPGMIYMLAGTLFTMLVFPQRAGVISTISIAAVCCLLCVGFNTGFIKTPAGIHYSSLPWMVVSVNLIGLSAMTVALVPPLFRKLEKAAERFKLVALSTNDTIWEWNPARDRITYSSGLTKSFGYDLKDLQASQEWWMSRIHPEDLQGIRQSFGAIVPGGDPSARVSCRFLTAGGEYKDVVIRATVLHDKAGAVECIIGSMEDVSVIKKYIAHIEKQNEALKAISWVQSHKVRSPVATILGLSGLLHDNGVYSDENKIVIEGIKESCITLDAVIREISELARDGNP